MVGFSNSAGKSDWEKMLNHEKQIRIAKMYFVSIALILNAVLNCNLRLAKAH